MVAKRRRLLTYLRNTDPERYKAVPPVTVGHSPLVPFVGSSLDFQEAPWVLPNSLQSGPGRAGGVFPQDVKGYSSCQLQSQMAL